MAELGVHRILLLVVSLTKCLEGTKLLSNLKKCGDLECETLISRVLAMSDYRGPDCLYLNFTKGEEISVYVKLAGEREDLWAGSKGKDFGYFPRDAVQIEEVFISEEVEIPTKESDFLCLLGVSYMFENEDNELSDNSENIYPYEEDDEQKSYVYENDFHLEPGFYATSESTVFEDQFSASEAPEDTRSMSKSKEWVEVEAESVEQDHIPEVDHVILPTAVPEGKGWFGLGKEHTEEMSFESTIEPTQESSFLGRKIAMEDENEREELSNGDLQTEHAQEPESEFDSVPKEQSELASESEHILKPPDTGWFGGGFKSYLGFGDEDTGLEVLPKESNPPLQDVPSSISSIEESTVPCTEILPEKEDPVINDSSILQSSWFDYGFGMLGFAYASEDKIKSDGGQHEGDAGGDEHEPPLASDFDPDKEQEIKMIDSIETEDQINEKVLEETDDSDTLPYFKKFLNNFGNPWSSRKIPKETELQSPQQTLDQKNAVANDETEEFSVENYPTDVVSKTELPIAIHEEAHFKTSSSNNNDETSKLSVDTEVMAHMETDNSVDDTLLNSQMVATENSLLAQKYFPQKAEDASKFPMLRYLFQVLYDFVNSAFSSIVTLTEMVSWPFKYFAIMYLFY